MQEYFHKNTFAGNPNALVELSFVGPLSLVTIHILSPVAQIGVIKFGLRAIMITGTVLIALSMEMAALSSQVCICLERYRYIALMS